MFLSSLMVFLPPLGEKKTMFEIEANLMNKNVQKLINKQFFFHYTVPIVYKCKNTTFCDDNLHLFFQTSSQQMRKWSRKWISEQNRWNTKQNNLFPLQSSAFITQLQYHHSFHFPSSSFSKFFCWISSSTCLATLLLIIILSFLWSTTDFWTSIKLDVPVIMITAL